jgi:hypothetical protein
MIYHERREDLHSVHGTHHQYLKLPFLFFFSFVKMPDVELDSSETFPTKSMLGR